MGLEMAVKEDSKNRVGIYIYNYAEDEYIRNRHIKQDDIYTTRRDVHDEFCA